MLHVYSTKGKPFKKSDPGSPDWVCLVFDVEADPPAFGPLMSNFEGSFKYNLHFDPPVEPLVICLQALKGIDNMQFISISGPDFTVPGKLKPQYGQS